MKVARLSLAALFALLALASAAHAGGPRYVAGPPFFTGGWGQPVGWQSPTPSYFTDPGALSASVNHAAADALVAAAASFWNVPVANITLAQGGVLAEHVSSANVYLSSSGIVYPEDVASSNYAAVPIAVIYDIDGSVTDTLLGGGASDPSGCSQNAVTESVDLFDPAGYIRHAVLILNGRCTGPAPQQQLQMQYQLERAFGRVLGLAWSQTNDNVFTGVPVATPEQALHWPILHPMDVLCGPYSYQCMPLAFQLRPDDIASLVAVYPIWSLNSQSLPGKQVSLSQANETQGQILFPTGQGMSDVNVLVSRYIDGALDPEPWASVSAVTGVTVHRIYANPVATTPSTPVASAGTTDPSQLGHYSALYVPIDTSGGHDGLIVSTEPINPLYSGTYLVGMYTPGMVAPSGTPPVPLSTYSIGAGGTFWTNATIPDAAATCGNGADGTASAPVPPSDSGWWNGLLCSTAHAAWTGVAVRPSRSLTLEVTALDQQGFATTAKAMPVMGAWASTDSTGGLPTLASAVSAFNSADFGMTSMTAATGTATGVTLAIADQRGAGRPDFAYQARVFYADTITPDLVSAAGGTATIAGLGFRAGNSVTVNGVLAPAVRWTVNSIVVTLPTAAQAGATNLTAVDVVVRDLSTGASSTMTAALTYDSASSLPNIMRLASAEVNPVYVGDAAALPFAVQVLRSDGLTPVTGDQVTFSASVAGAPGQLTYAACGAASCTLTTDANGMASSSLTPTAAGLVVLKALDSTSISLSQTASFPAIARTGSLVLHSAPSGGVHVGNSAAVPFSVTDLKADGVTPYSGRAITFSAPTGSVTFDACVAATCIVITNAQGVASTGVTPNAIGSTVVRAADGDASQSAGFTALANIPVIIVDSAPSGNYLSRTQLGQPFAVNLYQADGVTPIGSQPITFSYVQTAGTPVANAINFEVCGGSPCTILTNPAGYAITWLGSGAPGTFVLRAAYGNVVQTATFTALDPTLQLSIVSAPAGNQAVGTVSATPFSVQAAGLNGQSQPGSGFPIVLSITPGQALLSGCGSLPGCTFYTDGTGTVTTQVTPLMVGPITLGATTGQIALTTQFMGVVNGDILQIATAPSNPGRIDIEENAPFAIRVVGPDGVTPIAGRIVVLTATQGNATFNDCSATICSVVTNASGIVSSLVTPHAYGTVPMVASEGGNSIGSSFNVPMPPDLLRVVSAPSGNVPADTTASVPFTIQDDLGDGTTPLVNHTVVFSVISGSASLGACGLTICTVATDANGNASTTVFPAAPGVIALRVADGTVTQTASFTAVANTDTLSQISVPIGPVFVGNAAAPAFSVKVLAGNTPVSGRNVTFSVTNGAATIAGCFANPCIFASNSTGIASIVITPIAPGTIAFQAADGAALLAGSFLSVANVETLSAVVPQLYLAAGASVSWNLAANAMLNGAPAAGVPVAWTGSTGLTVAASSSLTANSGTATIAALAGPLTAPASARACAWSTACASFTALPVTASALTVQIVGGNAQSVSAGAALVPVVAQITDGAGHPVAGASVTILQTVTERSVACPLQGRCPAAPVLASGSVLTVSDIGGLVTIVPLSFNGVATDTNIAVTAGTQGFATAVLERSP